MDMLEIAKLEEGRQAEALAELADEVLRVGGGLLPGHERDGRTGENCRQRPDVTGCEHVPHFFSCTGISQPQRLPSAAFSLCNCT